MGGEISVKGLYVPQSELRKINMAEIQQFDLGIQKQVNLGFRYDLKLCCLWFGSIKGEKWSSLYNAKESKDKLEEGK